MSNIGYGGNMVKGRKHKTVEAIILTDEHLTNLLISKFSRYPYFNALKTHCKSLEFSCNGLVWLSVWLAFIYLFSKKNLFEMQINLLIGLLMDIFIIAILKSLCRRRRPTVPNAILTIGPDKYSFPSGHASRSSLIALFFICLSPIAKIWWLPLMSWCLCVCLSRILIQRHYILDVVAGIGIGIVEAGILCFIWLNEGGSQNILNFLLNDDVVIDVE